MMIVTDGRGCDDDSRDFTMDDATATTDEVKKI